VQSAGTVNDIALRASLGVLYESDSYSVSLHYTSAMGFEFDSAFLITGSEFGDLPLEQPQEVVLGASFALSEQLDWQMALLFKNWGDADAYEDIWDDQIIITTGLQYSVEQWSFRFGLGYSDDLRKEELGSSFGGNTSLGFGGQTIPLNPAIVEFLQASLAPSFWTYHVSGGIGYSFSRYTQLDMFVSTTFGSEERISSMNQTDVDFLTLGAGFSWRF
jgi:long-chain fatty acid transport protein